MSRAMINIYDYLTQKGYQPKKVLRPTGSFYLIRCPVCGEDDFAVNADTGSFNCFHLKKCGIKGSFRKLRLLMGDNIIMQLIPKQYETPKVAICKPDSEVGAFLQSRGFKPDVYREFRDVLGKKENAICFLYKYKGKLLSIKYRDLREKKFWKEKNCAPALFNMDMCEGKEDLFITEGELDVIAAKHYGIDAVSIPNGAQDESWIEYNWDYIQKFKRIILLFDNDEAGQKNIYRIAKRIGLGKVINVKLPYKDMNECLLQQVPEEEIYRAIGRGVEMGSEWVKTTDEYIQKMREHFSNKDRMIGLETPFAQLTYILKGWRNGELTIWTGINGSGKSNILLQIALDLAIRGQRVLIGSFEMQPERYLKWLAQMKVGEVDEFTLYEDVLRGLSGYLYCINKVGSIKATDLCDIIEYACRRYDVQHVVVDSLMRVMYRTQDIYKEQADFVVELCRIAQEYDIHIHLVAHPRKGDSDAEAPDKVDVAGSYDITNNAHNVIVVHRVDDNSKALKKLKVLTAKTVLIVKKNREHGTTGVCALDFNEKFKTFVDISGKNS